MSSPPAKEPATEPRPRLLLVGWDAADWGVIHPLLDRGEMPHLARVINEGVSGKLASVRPMLSPILWTTIATGQRADRHGVLGFSEEDPASGKLRPVTGYSRRCKAFWNILAQEGGSANVVGWFATHPAEPLPPGSAAVSDAFALWSPANAGEETSWPLLPGSVHPPELTETLADLRVRPEEISADVVRLFVPDWEKVDQERDPRLSILRQYLAECFSVHAAATWLLEHRPADCTAVYLRTIDWISHTFMPFHPPRMEGTLEGEFELYREVVNGIYRLHDALLGRLLHLAGEETTLLLVSDHGFFHDHRRPRVTPEVEAGIAAWHRPTGIVALRGPALRRDELIHGASLLDVAPTALALLGLPAGADMPGRVLVEAFREGALPASVPARVSPSWEDVPGDAGRLPPTDHGDGLTAEENDALLRQFQAIGYLSPEATAGTDAAVLVCRRESRWNLARALLDGGQFAEALPHLEALFADWPERGDFGLQLAHCQLMLGLLDVARATADAVLEGREAAPLANLLLGTIAFYQRQFSESLRLLRAAAAGDPLLPGVNNLLGQALIRHGAWDEAAAAFRRTLERDADDARAHLGLAHVALRQGRYEASVDLALQALGLAWHLPLAHFTLGAALARLGETARAVEAFEACLRHAPGYSPAHRFLARLLRALGEHERARWHRGQTGRTERQWQRAEADRASLRTEVAARARQRADARALVRAQTSAAAAPPAEAADDATSSLGQPKPLVIVSGLPRSGTSLLMAMLGAGGMPLLFDHARAPDEDNPDGYFEWEPIKTLAQNPRLLAPHLAAGCAVKVVSPLLSALPPEGRYQIIFLLRPVEEIAASQLRMRARLQPGGKPPEEAQLIELLRKHRDTTLAGLRAAAAAAPLRVRWLEISFPTLLRAPADVVGQLVAFLGSERLPRAEAMAAVVRPERRRHVLSK